MTREVGKCPECGGRLMRCGPEASGRTRRTCRAGCSQAPKEPSGVVFDHLHQRRPLMRDPRLGLAGLVLVDAQLEGGA